MWQYLDRFSRNCRRIVAGFRLEEGIENLGDSVSQPYGAIVPGTTPADPQPSETAAAATAARPTGLPVPVYRRPPAPQAKKVPDRQLEEIRRRHNGLSKDGLPSPPGRRSVSQPVRRRNLTEPSAAARPRQPPEARRPVPAAARPQSAPAPREGDPAGADAMTAGEEPVPAVPREDALPAIDEDVAPEARHVSFAVDQPGKDAVQNEGEVQAKPDPAKQHANRIREQREKRLEALAARAKLPEVPVGRRAPSARLPEDEADRLKGFMKNHKDRLAKAATAKEQSRVRRRHLPDPVPCDEAVELDDMAQGHIQRLKEHRRKMQAAAQPRQLPPVPRRPAPAAARPQSASPQGQGAPAAADVMVAEEEPEPAVVAWEGALPAADEDVAPVARRVSFADQTRQDVEPDEGEVHVKPDPIEQHANRIREQRQKRLDALAARAALAAVPVGRRAPSARLAEDEADRLKGFMKNHKDRLAKASRKQRRHLPDPVPCDEAVQLDDMAQEHIKRMKEHREKTQAAAQPRQLPPVPRRPAPAAARRNIAQPQAGSIPSAAKVVAAAIAGAREEAQAAAAAAWDGAQWEAPDLPPEGEHFQNAVQAHEELLVPEAESFLPAPSAYGYVEGIPGEAAGKNLDRKYRRRAMDPYGMEDFRRYQKTQRAQEQKSQRRYSTGDAQLAAHIGGRLVSADDQMRTASHAKRRYSTGAILGSLMQAAERYFARKAAEQARKSRRRAMDPFQMEGLSLYQNMAQRDDEQKPRRRHSIDDAQLAARVDEWLDMPRQAPRPHISGAAAEEQQQALEQARRYRRREMDPFEMNDLSLYQHMAERDDQQKQKRRSSDPQRSVNAGQPGQRRRAPAIPCLVRDPRASVGPEHEAMKMHLCRLGVAEPTEEAKSSARRKAARQARRELRERREKQLYLQERREAIETPPTQYGRPLPSIPLPVTDRDITIRKNIKKRVQTAIANARDKARRLAEERELERQEYLAQMGTAEGRAMLRQEERPVPVFESYAERKPTVAKQPKFQPLHHAGGVVKHVPCDMPVRARLRGIEGGEIETRSDVQIMLDNMKQREADNLKSKSVVQMTGECTSGYFDSQREWDMLTNNFPENDWGAVSALKSSWKSWPYV